MLKTTLTCTNTTTQIPNGFNDTRLFVWDNGYDLTVSIVIKSESTVEARYRAEKLIAEKHGKDNILHAFNLVKSIQEEPDYIINLDKELPGIIIERDLD